MWRQSEIKSGMRVFSAIWIAERDTGSVVINSYGAGVLGAG